MSNKLGLIQTKGYNLRELLYWKFDSTIMNFLTGLVTNIKEINSATFTGAVDIVIVEQEDGTFRSTPFHVR